MYRLKVRLQLFSFDFRMCTALASHQMFCMPSWKCVVRLFQSWMEKQRSVKSTRKAVDFLERTGIQLQNWSFVQVNIFPVSRHFRRKETDLAIRQGQAVRLLVKKHLLCCDYKPTDIPEQSLTQTSIKVLPRALCSKTKAVTPLWHMALPCRGGRATPGTAGATARQGHQEMFHAGCPALLSCAVLAKGQLSAKVTLLP